MKTIAVINQKGGVGKSTTAAALGAGFISKGYRTLFVDLDSQGNLSYAIGAQTSGKTAMGVLQRETSAVSAIQQTANGDIIPSSPALAVADLAITETGKEYRLREALETVSDSYDICIVDTPPSLGVLLSNALTACDGCIIPAQADIFSLQGVGQLSATIDTIRKYCNHDLKVYGILLTRYNSRTAITKEVTSMMEDTAGQLRSKVFKSRIRECTAIKEAQAMKQDIFSYAPRSNAATDYKALLSEMLEDQNIKQ